MYPTTTPMDERSAPLIEKGLEYARKCGKTPVEALGWIISKMEEWGNPPPEVLQDYQSLEWRFKPPTKEGYYIFETIGTNKHKIELKYDSNGDRFMVLHRNQKLYIDNRDERCPLLDDDYPKWKGPMPEALAKKESY